jgi:hypothetical protein
MHAPQPRGLTERVEHAPGRRTEDAEAMKALISRLGFVAAVVALVLAGVWLWNRYHPDLRTPTERAIPTASAPSADPRTLHPPDKVTQVSRAERDRLAQQIAAAHAARTSSTGSGAHAAPVPPHLPALPDTSHDVDRVPVHVLDALKQAMPYLIACYKEHAPAQATPGLTAVAMMTLTGDPDIGTVIDADQMYDEHHQPIDPGVDACMRATMQTLELPPLQEGDSVKLQYSFKFE